jgi:hypothetical protein
MRRTPHALRHTPSAPLRCSAREPERSAALGTPDVYANLELLCVLQSLRKYPSAPLDAKPMTSDLRRP